MQFLRTKIVQPLAEMPNFQKFMVMTVGTLGGIVPIPAITSAVTVGLGAAARLGPQGTAVATAWNLALTPMQFVCFVPFAQLGKAMLTAIFGLLLTFDPSSSSSATASADPSWFWAQVRALAAVIAATQPSLAVITESEGFSDLIANAGAMLAIGTFAWCLVTTAVFAGAYGFVRPILGGGAGKAGAKKAVAAKKAQ